MPCPSPAADAVLAATHPEPECDGPCATCAFRPDTEANQSEHTMELARLCVEGIVPFHCHERPQLCRGFVAAVNLRGAPETDEDRKWRECAAFAADVLGQCIRSAVEAQEAVDK